MQKIMKTRNWFVLGALCIMVLFFQLEPAEATEVAQGQCGDTVNWTLDGEGVLTISGTGVMWDFGGNTETMKECPWTDYMRQIIEVIIEDGVTYVGICAFEGASNMQSVTMADSITEIGNGAFWYCTSLAEITFPAGLEYFDSFLFYGCTSLENFVISEDAANYKTVDGVLYSKDGETLIAYPFAKKNTSYTVLEGTKYIRNEVFDGVDALEQITLPDSLGIIGENFNNMPSLRELTIPAGVYHAGWQTNIGFNCPALTKIVNLSEVSFSCPASYGDIDGNMTGEIPAQTTVYQYVRIESLAINPGIEVGVGTEVPLLYTVVYEESKALYKEKYAFTSSDESILTIDENGIMTGHAVGTVTITLSSVAVCDEVVEPVSCEIEVKSPEDVRLIMVDNIIYELMSTGTARVYSGANFVKKECVISQTVSYNGKNYTVTVIGANAFYENQIIESVTMPNSVIMIEGSSGESGAFAECVNLTEIVFSKKLVTIGSFAFSGCENLSSCVIPEKVKMIERFVFSGCVNLVEITLPDELKCIKDYAFENCEKLAYINVEYAEDSHIMGELDEEAVLNILAFTGCNALVDVDIPSGVHLLEGNSSGANYTVSGTLTIMPNTRGLLYDDTFVWKLFSGKLVQGYPGTFGDYMAAYAEEGFEYLGIINELLYTYEEIGNNEIELIEFLGYSGEHGVVEIPEQIDGKTVTEIRGVDLGLNGEIPTFNQYKAYHTIILPDTIRVIGTYAFGAGHGLVIDGISASWLTDIVIQEGVEIIEEDAFQYLWSMTEITFPESVMYMEGLIFHQMNYLERVNCPKYAMGVSFYDLPRDCVITGAKNSLVERAAKEEKLTFEATSEVAYFPFELDAEKWKETREFYIYDYVGSSTDIVVPAFYGSNPIKGITRIGKNNISGIFTLTIEEGIQELCASALSEIPYSDITLPRSMTSIEEYNTSYILYNSTSGATNNMEDYEWLVHVHGYKGTLAESWAKEMNDEYADRTDVLVEYIFTDVEKSDFANNTVELDSIQNVTDGIKLTWKAVEGADQYYIYRRQENGQWIKIASVKDGSTFYIDYDLGIDVNLLNGEVYTYTVKALGDGYLSQGDEEGLTIKRMGTIWYRLGHDWRRMKLYWHTAEWADGYYLYQQNEDGELIELAHVKAEDADADGDQWCDYKYINLELEPENDYVFIIRTYSGEYLGTDIVVSFTTQRGVVWEPDELEDLGELVEPDEPEVILTGWQKIDGKWYYYDADGDTVKGWQYINKKWYFFNTSGIMQTGWLKDGGRWYYLNSDGDMAVSWKKVNSKWYYFGTDGKMSTSWRKIGTKWYYFNIDGDMAAGWKKINSKWYYFNVDGDMQISWKKLNNKWYYFNADGDMHVGWKSISGSWYYFNSDGDMHIGWKSIGGIWYYFNSDGNMHTGWKQTGGSWYYFDSEGAMVTGRYKINEVWNTFTSDGAWIG